MIHKITFRRFFAVGAVMAILAQVACDKKEDLRHDQTETNEPTKDPLTQEQSSLQLAQLDVYSSVVKPMLDRNCMHCHASPAPANTALNESGLVRWNEVEKSKIYLTAVGISHPRIFAADAAEADILRNWINGDLSLLDRLLKGDSHNKNESAKVAAGKLDAGYFATHLQSKFSTCNGCHNAKVSQYSDAVALAESDDLVSYVRGIWDVDGAEFMHLKQWLTGAKLETPVEVTPVQPVESKFNRGYFELHIAPALEELCSSCHHNPVGNFEKAVALARFQSPDNSRLYLLAQSSLGVNAASSTKLKFIEAWIMGQLDYKGETQTPVEPPVIELMPLSKDFYDANLKSELTRQCSLCHVATSVLSFDAAKAEVTLGKIAESRLLLLALGRTAAVASAPEKAHPQVFAANDSFMQIFGQWIMGAQTVNDGTTFVADTLDRDFYNHRVKSNLDRWCGLCHIGSSASYKFENVLDKVLIGNPEQSKMVQIASGQFVTAQGGKHPLVWDESSADLQVLKLWIRGAVRQQQIDFKALPEFVATTSPVAPIVNGGGSPVEPKIEPVVEPEPVKKKKPVYEDE